MTSVTVTFNPAIDKTFSVEHVVPSRKLHAKNVREYPGGGGINVARAISNLKGESLALWSGSGPMAVRLGELLADERVHHRGVETTGDVRENLIVCDEAGGEQYRFGMPGTTLGEADLAIWMRELKGQAPSPDVVVFSGSLPGNTKLVWYEKLLSSLPPETKVIVDTKGPALRCALDTGIFLVKPNIHELECLLEQELAGDDEVVDAARKLVSDTQTEAVLVSLGRAGAFLVTGQGAWHLSSPSVPIRSKVGAGDSMVGGLVKALDDGKTLQQAARWGVAAGAAAVMTSGTDLCHQEDVERLEPGVRISEAAS